MISNKYCCDLRSSFSFSRVLAATYLYLPTSSPTGCLPLATLSLPTSFSRAAPFPLARLLCTTQLASHHVLSPGRSPTQRCSPCPLLCYPLAYMASSLSRARAVPALPYHLVGRSLALLCYGQLVGLRQPNSRCPLSVPTSSGLSPFCAHRLAYALATSPPACSLCHPASCSPSARPSPLLLHTLSCTHPSETMCARFPYRLHSPNSRYRLVVLPSMDIDVICSPRFILAPARRFGLPPAPLEGSGPDPHPTPVLIPVRLNYYEVSWWLGDNWSASNLSPLTSGLSI